jgi:AcrR family transcriptional regulator
MMKQSLFMQKRPSSEIASNVLEPSTPTDIGERSQRRRILAAMIASCAEKTYTATTITDIVGAARISRTTFYKRFADKRECFDAAVDACIEEVQEAARDAYSPADPPAEAARKATTAVLELMAAKPDLAQLLCGEAHSVDPSVPRRYRKLAVPALERLWADGSGPPEPHLDPRLAFGRAHVLVFDRLAGGSEARLLELAPELVYLAVAPFAGHDEALRKAQISAGEGGDGRR